MRIAAALLLGIALGCVSNGPDPPTLLSVTPGSGAPGVTVPITITGRFHLGIDVDYDTDKSDLSSTFTGTLGGLALTHVEYVSQTELTATAPGLGIGVHELEIVDPNGRSASLPEAFEVKLSPSPSPTPSPSECLVVTVEVDELNEGETEQPPHQGTGLSLREAMTLVNAGSERNCIHFAAAMLIKPDTPLPEFAPPTPTVIDGMGNIELDGSVTSGIGLQVGSPGNVIRGLTIRQFSDDAIRIEDAGRDTVVDQCVIFDNGKHSVDVRGTGVTIQRTLAFRNDEGIRIHSGLANIRIVHVTVSGPSWALRVDGSSTVATFFNNILRGTGAEDYAIEVNGSASANVDYCMFRGFENNCSGCTVGSNSITGNPLFLDEAAGDFRLEPESLAVDAGADLGLDVNGAGAGLYNGMAPDLGALETP